MTDKELIQYTLRDAEIKLKQKIGAVETAYNLLVDAQHKVKKAEIELEVAKDFHELVFKGLSNEG